MRWARLFASQFPAPAAGAPGEAERSFEERFEGWDTGGYDADCFFETVERLVGSRWLGVRVREQWWIGREKEWTYIAQITNGTRSPETVTVSLVDKPAEGRDLHVTSVAARFLSSTVRTMAQMPELRIINKHLKKVGFHRSIPICGEELTRNPFPSKRRYPL